MICNKCGKNVSDEAVFCSYCGNKTELQYEDLSVLVCKQCKIHFDGGLSFCDRCGKKLVPLKKKTEKSSSKIRKIFSLSNIISFAIGFAFCVLLVFLLWLCDIICFW